jgi:hypothetical protein
MNAIQCFTFIINDSIDYNKITVNNITIDELTREQTK